MTDMDKEAFASDAKKAGVLGAKIAFIAGMMADANGQNKTGKGDLLVLSAAVAWALFTRGQAGERDAERFSKLLTNSIKLYAEGYEKSYAKVKSDPSLSEIHDLEAYIQAVQSHTE